MSKRRLHVGALPEEGGGVELDAAASHHARVLRLGLGDVVRLFDGRGREADARIVASGGERLRCHVEEAEDARPLGPRVVLIQCMPKGSKLESIVRMTTELGVNAIHLARSARAVARPDPERAARRVERLSNVAREAARQAGRVLVPDVVPPAPLSDVAGRAPGDAHRWVLWEEADEPLEASATEADVWLVVGPEGGLVDTEVQALAARGFEAVGLGSCILRVETAAPVGVALALDRVGAMKPSAPRR